MTVSALAAYIPSQITLTNVAHGLRSGAGFAFNKQQEDTVRQGANIPLSSILQASEVFYATRLTQAALSLAAPTFTASSIVVTAAVCTPLVVGAMLCATAMSAFLKSIAERYPDSKLSTVGKHIGHAAEKVGNFADKPNVKYTLLKVHDNVGTTSQVACAVSAVALTVLGNPAMGLSALACLSTAFAAEKGLIPHRVRAFLSESYSYATIATNLLVGGIAAKAWTITFLAISAFQVHTEKTEKSARFQLANAPSAQLSLEEVSKGRFVKDVNRNHIHRIHILPQEPAEELTKELSHVAEAINWNDSDLRKKIAKTLHNDDDWKKFLASGEKVIYDGKKNQWQAVADNAQSHVAYIRWGLEQFATKIEKKRISQGEPLDYTPLRIMAKKNVQAIKMLPIEKQYEFLLNMGMSSYYCGAGFFLATESDNLILEGLTTKTLKGKIDVHLAQLREQLFQTFYFMAIGGNPFMKIVGESDIHNYHLFIKQYAYDLGIPHQIGAENDLALYQSPFDRFIMKKYFALVLYIISRMEASKISKLSQKEQQAIKQLTSIGDLIFTEEYTVNRIRYEIKQAIIAKNISSQMLGDWFKEWALREVHKKYPTLSIKDKKVVDEAEFFVQNHLLRDPFSNSMDKCDYTDKAIDLLLAEHGVFNKG